MRGEEELTVFRSSVRRTTNYQLPRTTTSNYQLPSILKPNPRGSLLFCSAINNVEFWMLYDTHCICVYMLAYPGQACHCFLESWEMALCSHLPTTFSEGSFADSTGARDDLQDGSPGP